MLLKTFTFKFDIFVQSRLECIQGIQLSVCVFSESQSHDLGVANTMFWTPETIASNICLALMPDLSVLLLQLSLAKGQALMC